MENETLDHLLSEEEIRQQMGEITRRYLKERARFKTASDAWRKAERQALLAITYLQTDLLKDPRAKEYVERALVDKTKLNIGDKEAIIGLEHEAIQDEYLEAKHDCDTSDKLFEKLTTQLMYFQSLMKFTGPTERN